MASSAVAQSQSAARAAAAAASGKGGFGGTKMTTGAEAGGPAPQVATHQLFGQ
jgi:hypothetical protein